MDRMKDKLKEGHSRLDGHTGQACSPPLPSPLAVFVSPPRLLPVMLLLIFLLNFLLILAASGCEPVGTFVVARQGCAMAHCDGSMSDLARMPVPVGPETNVVWRDLLPVGAKVGLGCVSNGRTAVCAYGDEMEDALVAYDGRGDRLWTSGDHLGPRTWVAAPMIDRTGGVVSADEDHLIRFRPDGSVLWKTALPGGIPLSPVLTLSGVVVVATKGGPVSAFDSLTGEPIGSLTLRDTPEDPDYYHTINTPCVVGNRVYISTEKLDDPDFTARLWAVDVDRSDTEAPLRPVWSFVFGGPSGASPMVSGDTVFFDGDRLDPGGPENPHIFAVRELGDSWSLKWKQPLDSPVRASVARDPRGGLWAFSLYLPYLDRYDLETGARLDRIDVDALLDEPGLYFPSSAMTIAGDESDPVMIVGLITASPSDPSWIAAVGLEAGSLLWKVRLAEMRSIDSTSAQFSIVLDDEDRPVIVFPGWNQGAYGVSGG